MVRMDLLQHCAIEAVLYNKPSLSLLSLLLSPHVTMCLWLTLGLIHCDLLFVKTSYKRATPRSRVCIVGHPQYTILFLWQMWSWQQDQTASIKQQNVSLPIPSLNTCGRVSLRMWPPGCELVCWYGGPHGTAHVPAVVSYHKPSCQSLSIGHLL